MSAVVNSEVAALLRRFHGLTPRQQYDVHVEVTRYLDAGPPSWEAERLARRAEAVRLISAASAEFALAPGERLQARMFNHSAAAHAAGWNAARVIRLFGRWSFAIDTYLGGARVSATQRAAQSRARRGVLRSRDDYLRGVRLWLESDPPSRRTVDYDNWRAEYNAQLPPGELPLVSYSMLRQAFRCSWTGLLALAAGQASQAPEPDQPRSAPRRRRQGPHDLVSFAEVQELLGLGTTAARNLTRSPDFPAPAYTHPRGARTRLWRRVDVAAFATGAPVPRRAENELQHEYVDARALSEILGVTQISVTTRSAARVSDPDVALGGLQLWLRSRFAAAE